MDKETSSKFEKFAQLQTLADLMQALTEHGNFRSYPKRSAKNNIKKSKWKDIRENTYNQLGYIIAPENIQG